MGNKLLNWLTLAAASDDTGRYNLTRYQRQDGIDYCLDGFRLHMIRSPETPISARKIVKPLDELVASVYVNAGEVKEGAVQAIASYPRSFKVAAPPCFLAFPDGQVAIVQATYLRDAIGGTGDPPKCRIGLWGEEHPILVQDSERCALVMPLSVPMANKVWPRSEEVKSARLLAKDGVLRIVTFVRYLPYLAGEAQTYLLDEPDKLFYPLWASESKGPERREPEAPMVAA